MICGRLLAAGYLHELPDGREVSLAPRRRGIALQVCGEFRSVRRSRSDCLGYRYRFGFLDWLLLHGSRGSWAWVGLSELTDGRRLKLLQASLDVVFIVRITLPLQHCRSSRGGRKEVPDGWGFHDALHAIGNVISIIAT